VLSPPFLPGGVPLTKVNVVLGQARLYKSQAWHLNIQLPDAQHPPEPCCVIQRRTASYSNVFPLGKTTGCSMIWFEGRAGLAWEWQDNHTADRQNCTLTNTRLQTSLRPAARRVWDP